MKKPTVAKLKKKLTRVFNEYIRLRDKGKLCISCGKRKATQAGHYLPISLCPKPSMVFNEKNVNGQCAYCNCWLHGNQHDYRLGLIAKYGEHIIDELESSRHTAQEPWGIFAYETMIKHYKEKLCALQS